MPHHRHHRQEARLPVVAGVAAWASVVTTSVVFTALFAVGGTAPVDPAAVLAAMVGWHAVIGIGEGADVVLAARRPDDLAEQTRALLDAGATLVDCGDDAVSTAAILEHCGVRGWSRVLCEGGPSLLGSLVAADAVDELCLTTSPHLVGGIAGGLAAQALLRHKTRKASFQRALAGAIGRRAANRNIGSA